MVLPGMCRFRRVKQRQCYDYYGVQCAAGTMQPYLIGEGAIPLLELNRVELLQLLQPGGAIRQTDALSKVE